MAVVSAQSSVGARRWADQDISVGADMPADVPRGDACWVFASAWALGVKGITAYRDESKSVQVI